MVAIEGFEFPISSENLGTCSVAYSAFHRIAFFGGIYHALKLTLRTPTKVQIGPGSVVGVFALFVTASPFHYGCQVTLILWRVEGFHYPIVVVFFEMYDISVMYIEFVKFIDTARTFCGSQECNKLHLSRIKINNLKLLIMDHWVWYQDEIALVVEHDESTDFCELKVLCEYPRQYQGKKIWVLAEENTLSSMSETRECTEHDITEIRDGIFIIDDGDVEYSPSESDEESDEDYNDSEV